MGRRVKSRYRLRVHYKGGSRAEFTDLSREELLVELLERLDDAAAHDNVVSWTILPTHTELP